jgi:hypothetical protein
MIYTTETKVVPDSYEVEEAERIIRTGTDDNYKIRAIRDMMEDMIQKAYDTALRTTEGND